MKKILKITIALLAITLLFAGVGSAAVVDDDESSINSASNVNGTSEWLDDLQKHLDEFKEWFEEHTKLVKEAYPLLYYVIVDYVKGFIIHIL